MSEVEAIYDGVMSRSEYDAICDCWLRGAPWKGWDLVEITIREDTGQAVVRGCRRGVSLGRAA